MSALAVGHRLALPASAIVAVVAVVLLATGVGAAIGLGQPMAAAVAAVPLVTAVLAILALKARWTLVLIALALTYAGAPFTDRIALGGTGVWISDFVIGLAVVGWVAEWLSKPAERRPRLPRAAVLGIPVLLLAITLLIGAERGSERYGASLIGMPLRLVAYAMIATAITNVTPRQALRGLTVVFYAGVLYQAGVASYHIATGTSATEHLNLSTGGIRYIGIGPATYAAASVLIALLNLARSEKHRGIHLAFLAIACLTVLVAYTRTVWLLIGIEVLVILVVSSRARQVTLSSLPIVVPFLVIGGLGIAAAKPDLITTFSERLSTPASQDSSVQWRTYAYQAVLSGVSDERLLGVGFGRTQSFSINGQPNYITGDPHNGYIYVYAGGGILALAALILVMLTYLWDLASRWKWGDEDGRTLLAFSLGMWFIFMGHAVAEPIFTEPTMLLTIWIATLLPAMVVPPGPEPLLGAARRTPPAMVARRLRRSPRETPLVHA